MSSAQQLDGKITRREFGKIFVNLFPTRGWRFDDDVYDVFFKVNRMIYQLQHNALNFVKKHRLFSILINNPSYHSQSLYSLDQSDDFELPTNPNELNKEQMRAVKCIVDGEYNPVPYLIYGPPGKICFFQFLQKTFNIIKFSGTGKTKTVVAAIEKIVRTTNKNILVCAQSNAACNEIAERLASLLSKTQMLRLFSLSYDLDKISATIKPFCNLYDGELEYPSLECLYEFRVLICTLSTSGCLVRARISTDFNPKHFGYVFIDECASAHETMALIPIAGKDKIVLRFILYSG